MSALRFCLTAGLLTSHFAIATPSGAAIGTGASEPVAPEKQIKVCTYPETYTYLPQVPVPNGGGFMDCNQKKIVGISCAGIKESYEYMAAIAKPVAAANALQFERAWADCQRLPRQLFLPLN